MSQRRLTWDHSFESAPDATIPPAVAEDRARRQAWDEGYAAGRDAGQAEGRAAAVAADETRCAAALEQILAAVAQQGDALHTDLSDIAAAGARTIVFALQALLSDLAPRFAATQAERLVEAAILAAAGRPALAVTAAPNLAPLLTDRFAGHGTPQGLALTVTADAALTPGAVRARWDGGSAHWDAAGTAARIAAVLDQLLKDLDHDAAE
jgi:flagellar biosynthesis/type III secretory pathway protein FliH